MLLNDKDMFQEWIRDVKTMSGRIIEMREALYDQLVNKLKTPGDWKHITSQIGMFSFTGLNPDQCKKMVENAHIYMTGNGEYPFYPTPLRLSYRVLRNFLYCVSTIRRLSDDKVHLANLCRVTLYRTHLNGRIEHQ